MFWAKADSSLLNRMFLMCLLYLVVKFRPFADTYYFITALAGHFVYAALLLCVLPNTLPTVVVVLMLHLS
jgi:hypothetical protein